jgi:ABC-type bacteriocin/lantibiotic exporter with double-glycine peptidase domain
MMGLILVSLSLKWMLGIQSSVLGENVIRLLRRRVYENSFSADAKVVSSGTRATAVSAEAEELGKFTGGAFSDPVVQIGTLISVVGFIASTQPYLGVIVAVMILPQVILVLLTQPVVNRLVARRVHVLRQSTDKMTAPDVTEIDPRVLEDFDAIYETRQTMFRWKQSTKFLLSSINSAGTVGVLALGGWLVLQGRSDVGTVVAAVAGLGRIQGPTTYLIAFYRQVSAMQVKYELLREIVITPTARPT